MDVSPPSDDVSKAALAAASPVAFVLVAETAEFENPADGAVTFTRDLLCAAKKNRKGEGEWRLRVRRAVMGPGGDEDDRSRMRRPVYAVIAVGDTDCMAERAAWRSNQNTAAVGIPAPPAPLRKQTRVTRRRQRVRRRPAALLPHLQTSTPVRCGSVLPLVNLRPGTASCRPHGKDCNQTGELVDKAVEALGGVRACPRCHLDAARDDMETVVRGWASKRLWPALGVGKTESHT